ncbi:hypothetical protein, partial [Micromonospora sp. NPDC023814]|uniref:hypothetical protein n=1 Tax=Micromonospora sp. NPDC023814 TaxID=3154596 RepID=UPI0033D3FFC3
MGLAEMEPSQMGLAEMGPGQLGLGDVDQRGPGGSAGVAEAAGSPQRAVVVDGWGEGGKDPQAVPSTGTVRTSGQLSVAGHKVPVGGLRGEEKVSTAGEVSYWYTESTVWVQWPDDGKKMVTYPRPTFTAPSAVDGWPQDRDPQATHGTGTVTAHGALSVAGHRVSVGKRRGGKPAQGKVEYWYTPSRVWVKWQEPAPARKVMVAYPRPAFAKPELQEGWNEEGVDPQAVPGTGTVTANGALNVAGHRVSVGMVHGEKKESTAGEVSYWYTESTVWVQWQQPDDSGPLRQVMVTYPQPTLSRPSVVDNWGEGVDPQATHGTGTVKANGQLSVAGRHVSVGQRRGGKPAQGAVEYWYTPLRVWVQWPDGRQAMVAFPWRTLIPAAGRGGGPGGQAGSRPAVGGDAATTVLLAWIEPPSSSVWSEGRQARTRPAGPVGSQPGTEASPYLHRRVRDTTSGS